jgi:hypothetical protein
MFKLIRIFNTKTDGKVELRIKVHSKDALSQFRKGMGEIADRAFLLRAAVDFSRVADERLQQFAYNLNLNITVLQKNLCEKEAFFGLDAFDLVVINHYRLKPHLYPLLAKHIKSGGILWVNGFYKISEDHPDLSQQDLIAETDFRYLTAFACDECRQYKAGTRILIRYLWRKTDIHAWDKP